MILISFFAIIYLAVFYLMGIYFGYYNSTVKLSVWSLCNYIIPITIIIISSEIIRYVFLSQKAKTSKLVAFLSMILIDIIVYSQVYDLTKLDDFLAMMGFVLFASISCNLLYNYICNRFGAKPIIIYRLITTLYVYIIPIVPDIYLFFRSVLRMIYPYIIYMVLEYTYSKTNFVSNYQDRKKKLLIQPLFL